MCKLDVPRLRNGTWLQITEIRWNIVKAIIITGKEKRWKCFNSIHSDNTNRFGLLIWKAAIPF